MPYNLSSGLANSASVFADRTALVTSKAEFTYGELQDRVQKLAAQLEPLLSSGRVGILSTRSAEACIGILATAWAGGTYVPISLKFPEQKLRQLFALLELDALIIDAAGWNKIRQSLADDLPRAVFVPDGDSGSFKCIGERIPEPMPRRDAPVEVAADHCAYIEFTSGTTGTPKGVMVPASAVKNYLDVIAEWYDFSFEDRAAETCDITFDLSVHNMLSTWQAGGALYIMRALDMVSPARFIRANRITTWLSVPSVVALARKAGGLEPGCLPSLRVSLFCGEPLPAETAEEWGRAAPNSLIDNIYGPTEATIACTRLPWSAEKLTTPGRGIVSIGTAFPGMEVCILDAQNRPLPAGEPGEIALSGAQLASGYFRQPELTEARFPVIDGKRWYLTGDRGFCHKDGRFHHLGRLDNQIKLNGHRVELEEVDAGLREAARSDVAATVVQQSESGIASELIGFVAQSVLEPQEIMTRLRGLLPAYMVPTRLEMIETMPLNNNGKIDRRALLGLVETKQPTLAETVT